MSRPTARRIQDLLNANKTGAAGHKGTASARLVLHVVINADEPTDGYYPCTPYAFLPEIESWEAYDDGLVIDPNGDRLFKDRAYLGLCYGVNDDGTYIYATAGCCAAVPEEFSSSSSSSLDEITVGCCPGVVMPASLCCHMTDASVAHGGDPRSELTDDITITHGDGTTWVGDWIPYTADVVITLECRDTGLGSLQWTACANYLNPGPAQYCVHATSATCSPYCATFPDIFVVEGTGRSGWFSLTIEDCSGGCASSDSSSSDSGDDCATGYVNTTCCGCVKKHLLAGAHAFDWVSDQTWTGGGLLDCGGMIDYAATLTCTDDAWTMDITYSETGEPCGSQTGVTPTSVTCSPFELVFDLDATGCPGCSSFTWTITE